jgi:hypothetical protein
MDLPTQERYTMEHQKRKFPSKKNLIFIAIISLVLISAISIETHKKTLLFPGQLTGKSIKGEEIEGFVSHAEFEQDCGHCHGPIHCVEDRRCQDCHFTVTQERANAIGLHGRLPGIKQCENCHPEHRGREAQITSFAYNNVDHELLADFSLDRHQFDYDNDPMGCQSCHSQDSFISERLDCITCHSNGDHDFVASHIELYGTDCTSCHDGKDHYSNFEHAEVYVLDGQHGDLECEACHQEKQYAGTPQECSGCHQEPEIHTGLFGQKCESCHSVSAWNPAELKSHTFLVDHGVSYRPICETCHKDTYTEYRCSSCHDAEEMGAVHLQEGIYTINDCTECHSSGRENEAPQIREQKSENENLGVGNNEEKPEVRAAQSAEEKQPTDGKQHGGESNNKDVGKRNIKKNPSNKRGGS